LSDIIASPRYEEFYPPTYKGMKQDEFFLKTKQLQSVQKTRFRKHPLILYGMKADIFFLLFQKS